MSIQRVVVKIILAIGLANSAIAEPQQGTLVDKIIARVDDQIILQSELEAALQQCQAQGMASGLDLKRRVLAGMLEHKMLLARAQAEGVSVEKVLIEDNYNREMQELLAQLGSEAAIAQRMGKPIQAFKEKLKKISQERLIIEQMQKKILGDLFVTPREVQAFFDALPVASIPYYPAEVEVRQIVCYPTPSQQDKAAIIEQLQVLKARTQAGEKFEKLAKQHSEDEHTASRSGELGFRRLGELAPAYEAAVLALKPGEISGPVETPSGFHLIQLIERQKDHHNTRHILIRPSASATSLQETAAHLDSIRTSILVGHTTFEEAAQQYSQDIATAPQGGLLTSAHGGARMPIDDLPTEVFFAINKLASGTITEPATVTVAPDKQAVRILYLKEKVPPHPANLQQDYDKIAQMALAAKRAAALKEWLQNTQAEVFIKVDPAYQDCAILD